MIGRVEGFDRVQSPTQLVSVPRTLNTGPGTLTNPSEQVMTSSS